MPCAGTLGPQRPPCARRPHARRGAAAQEGAPAGSRAGRRPPCASPACRRRALAHAEGTPRRRASPARAGAARCPRSARASPPRCRQWRPRRRPPLLRARRGPRRRSRRSTTAGARASAAARRCRRGSRRPLRRFPCSRCGCARRRPPRPTPCLLCGMSPLWALGDAHGWQCYRVISSAVRTQNTLDICSWGDACCAGVDAAAGCSSQPGQPGGAWPGSGRLCRAGRPLWWQRRGRRARACNPR